MFAGFTEKARKSADRLIPIAQKPTHFWRKPEYSAADEAARIEAMNDRLDVLSEKHPPLNPDNVDYSIQDPRAFVRKYEHATRLLAETEYKVTLNVKQIEAALPNALDSTEKRFTGEYWNPQEFMHGVILDRLGQVVGMDPVEVDTETIQTAIKFAGMLTTYVPSAATAFLHAYYVKGAITESTATTIYKDWGNRMIRDGDEGFARTGLFAIGRQEPTHFWYYDHRAKMLLAQMSPWELHLSRTLSNLGRPLPGLSKANALSFGYTLNEVWGTDTTRMIWVAYKVDRVYRELLRYEEQGGKVPNPTIHNVKTLHQAAQDDMKANGLIIPQLSGRI